ncbi:MAG: hypothetical protein LBD86_02245 [Spirochaetaceae bacterium]|jgi:hypothetical protein|nr:hypothetical protein [Spirochaetaceae bacterium]
MKAYNKKYIRFLLPLVLLAAKPCFGQDGGTSSFTGVVPEILTRPSRESGWVYPFDFVIGQLGGGEASDAANAYARGVLRDLMRRDDKADTLKDLGPALLNEAMAKVGEVGPRKVRSGGGREEPDGSVSFLFRFMGGEKELSGELYIRNAAGAWKTEDVIFETPQNLSSEGGDYGGAEHTPYERFY